MEYLKKEENKCRYKGVIGCWIAHSRILEPIKERVGITVILEDDFVCKKDFFENALRMVNSFDKDFDVVIFDPFGEGPLGMHRVAENIYTANKYTYPYYHGIHCMFVRNDRIPKILEAKLNSQILDYDAFLLIDANIDSYIFYTGACGTRLLQSDITPGGRRKFSLLDISICLLPPVFREKSRLFNDYFYKKKEKAVSLTEPEMAAFEGCYRSHEQTQIVIWTISKNSRTMLMVLWIDGSEVAIHPMSEVDFLAEQFPVEVKFNKSENGEVAGVLIDNQYSFQKCPIGEVMKPSYQLPDPAIS
jgi:GR25 family glycosyltransferase involved in LPS biosynthesis